MNNCYNEPFKDASYQVPVHLNRRFRRRFFLEMNQLETRIACGAMFVNGLGLNENMHRGLSIDAYYQISVHLAKRFQRRRFFRNRLIRNKNCLWWPCLWTNRDKMSNLYRGPSIDASYQISVHLTKQFQGRRFKLCRSPFNLLWGNLIHNLPRPNNLSLVCLYMSLYIFFLLFGHFFWDTLRQKALLYKSSRKHTICMRWKFWDFSSFV